MAVLVALIRGFARHNARRSATSGSDLDAHDALHPAAAGARAGARAGVAGRRAELRRRIRRSTLLEPVKDADGKPVTEQVLPMGPAASQIAIKQLGTNGGGFFNANSAHPFENPTPLSNFLEMLAILLIPAALCYTFGQMVGDTRQGWAILAAMVVIFVGHAWRRARTSSSRARRSWPPPAPTSTPGDRASRRQHGRQGGPLRHRRFRPLGDRHDGRLQRLGQLHARLLHAAGRPGADVADPAGRGHLRRRRVGPVRHAHLRHRGGVRRRA